MVKACRAHTVLAYNDMVVNRMTAGGNDVISHCNGNDFWGPKASSTGTLCFGLTLTYGVDKYTGKINTVEFRRRRTVRYTSTASGRSTR